MSSLLCETCFSIPPHFWSEDLDDKGFPDGPPINLQPYRSMEAAATAGCPLCRFLLKFVKIEHQTVTESTLVKSIVTLARSSTHSKKQLSPVLQGRELCVFLSPTFFRVPDIWCDGPPLGVDGNIDNFQIMRKWIQICNSDHAECKNNRENFLPTRLLDVEAFQTGQDIQLVLLRTDDYNNRQDRPDYITLSHCWGPPEKRPITTTRANIQDRMTRISIDELPTTFRDAVSNTKELGKRYLWIDCLCIIQDDRNDWEREAALMAMVYGQSFCTLAALDSEDSTEGCKLVSNIQNISPFLEFDLVDSSHRIRVFECNPVPWSEGYGESYSPNNRAKHPLRSRGWTLQERELSRRTINFGSSQMLWECRRLKASTQLPWRFNEPEHIYSLMEWSIRDHLCEDFTPNCPVATRNRWYELVEDYSARDLTHDTDKLPAISGIAQEYQHAVPDAEYLAGTWSAHLPAALLWQQRISDGSRTKSYIAPTWSWASTVGGVSYKSQRIYGEMNKERPEECSSSCDYKDLSISSTSMKLRSENKYGAVLSGRLSLNGALLVCIDSNLRRKSNNGLETHIFHFSKSDVAVGLIYADAPSELLNGPYPGELFCLRIREEPEITSNRYLYRPLDELYETDVGELSMGLVLAKESNGENEPRFSNEYKRIGLARWVKNSLFETCLPSAVTLI